MARSAKIAISIDPDLLGSVERARARSGESRSAVVARALRMLMREDALAELRAGYVRAYRNHPETDAEVASARERAVRSLRGLPWHEE